MRLKPFDVYRASMLAEGALNNLISTLLAIYFIQNAHLNALQLVLVGAALQVTILVCEVPTGVVADVYSRRLSVSLGFALTGAAYLLTGLVPLFSAIVCGACIRGVAETFISGAREAWIADELAVRQPEVSADHAFVVGGQLAFIGRLGGVWMAIAFARINLSAPIVAGATGFLFLAAIYWIFASEQGFHRVSNSHSLADLRLVFDKGFQLVRSNRILLTIVGVTSFVGLSSEGFDRLWQKRLIDGFDLPHLLGDPHLIWGLITTASLLGSLGMLQVARRGRFLGESGLRELIFGLLTLVCVGSLVFGFAPNLLVAIFAYLSVRMSRHAAEPLLKAWANRHASSEVRATVLSLASQMDSIGQIVGGPLIGLIARFGSLPWAMVGSGVLASPPAALLGIQIFSRGRNARED